MKKLFLIGGGGHCESCIDVIESTGEFSIEGIFDVKEKVGSSVLGYPVVGTDEDIDKYTSDGHYFLITLGQIKSSKLREGLFSKNLNWATVVSSRAHVSKHAQIGKGTIVMHDALINAKAEVGVNCIINSKALIEHGCKIGDHCHIATAAVINGDCKIDSSSFIGSNTVLKQESIIEKNSIVPYGVKK